jgi:hypothetical protein
MTGNAHRCRGVGALARQIAGDLDAAAFAHRPVSPIRAIVENAQAHLLIAEARPLARSAR